MSGNREYDYIIVGAGSAGCAAAGPARSGRSDATRKIRHVSAESVLAFLDNNQILHRYHFKPACLRRLIILCSVSVTNPLFGGCIAMFYLC